MVDYSLYLVTSQSLLPPGVDLLTQIQSALEGGVTILQLREKDITTAAFIDLATQILPLAKRYNVPLIINDRLDVLLAAGADGVHVGQDDMKVATARQLIGGDKILGVTVNTIEEAERAINSGADYISIGAVFDTKSKTLTTPPCGIAGYIIRYCRVVKKSKIKIVAIGGINSSNIQRVKYQTTVESPKDHIWFALDGVAVVSAIISSENAKSDTESLKILWNEDIQPKLDTYPTKVDDLKQKIAGIPKTVLKRNPLIHHMTNNVVKNFSANVTLAIGASPIMSEEMAEVDDLNRCSGALLLNMGMIDSRLVTTMSYAAKKSNENKVPIVFDPVGIGASVFREKAARKLLESGIINVIKGNEAEIQTLLRGQGQGRMIGVDSNWCGTLQDKISLAEKCALQERAVVACTGEYDVISNGWCSVVSSHGHPLLGQVTGTGCALGSVIAACCAVEKDVLSATAAAVIWYGVAAGLAAVESNGPGTFLPNFLDKLNKVQTNDVSWWMDKVNIDIF